MSWQQWFDLKLKDVEINIAMAVLLVLLIIVWYVFKKRK